MNKGSYASLVSIILGTTACVTQKSIEEEFDRGHERRLIERAKEEEAQRQATIAAVKQLGSGKYAFERRAPKVLGGFELCVTDSEGKTTIPIVYEMGSPITDVALSPDQQKIIYKTANEQTYRLDFFVVNNDGTGKQCVTREIEKNRDKYDIEFYHATWAPNSKDILLIANNNKELKECAVYTIDVRNGGATNITPEGLECVIAAWSTDGEKIAFVGIDGLWTMMNDGAGKKIIRPKNIWEQDILLRTRELAWSHDNTKLAMVVERDDYSFAAPVSHSRIYYASADGSNFECLTDGSSPVMNIRWELDGSIRYSSLTTISGTSAWATYKVNPLLKQSIKITDTGSTKK